MTLPEIKLTRTNQHVRSWLCEQIILKLQGSWQVPQEAPSHQFWQTTSVFHVWCACNMCIATYCSPGMPHTCRWRCMPLTDTQWRMCGIIFNVFEHIGWCQHGFRNWLASQPPNQVDIPHVDMAWCQTVQPWIRKLETTGYGTQQHTQQYDFPMVRCTKWQHDAQLDNSWANAFPTSPS